MIEIRGQQASDWQDLYQIRVASAGHLPYIRPDWVKQELATLKDGTWPLVAVVAGPEGPKVVARVDIQSGLGRRRHIGRLVLERHPGLGLEASEQLLAEAVGVAEGWWNLRRLEAVVPNTDPTALALFREHEFEQEACLKQSVRIAGNLVDEYILARLTGDASGPASNEPDPPPNGPANARRERRQVTVRGGSGDDWEAIHTIWSQPSVYWGTMQLPYPSADWNRRRVQERTPEGFWPLVAEVNGQVVGNAGLHLAQYHRSHAGYVGMMVHHDYQGQGIGSALMEAMIELADDWLGLTRLQLEVYTDNVRAIGLYEKYGFQTEGVHRAYVYRNGRYQDSLVMGRLNHD